jgi:hypothetical protein
MAIETEESHQQSSLKQGYILSASVTLLSLCLFLLAACGTPPPSTHPLSFEETPLPGMSGTGTASGGAHMLPIQVVSAQTHLTTYPGAQMTMTISTSPYALCSFSVSYGKSLPSANVGIVPHTADAHGVVSWTWVVDRNAYTGNWPLAISASLAGKGQTSRTVMVSVIFPPITIITAQSKLAGYPKQTLSLTISTAPDVQCLLVVNDGPSKPVKRLKTVTNSSGVAVWTWYVSGNAASGEWPLSIVVTLVDGEQGSAQATMMIL